MFPEPSKKFSPKILQKFYIVKIFKITPPSIKPDPCPSQSHTYCVTHLAFITTQKEHLIVWNNHGDECQRFNLGSLYRMTQVLRDVGDTYSDYSFYHMSKYSHKVDLMFFISYYNQFFVVPNFKNMTFRGKLPGTHYYDLISVHFMNNSSSIWLLGGAYMQVNLQRKTTDFERNLLLHHETRILNLE